MATEFLEILVDRFNLKSMNLAEFYKNYGQKSTYNLLGLFLASEDPQTARNETKTLFQTPHVSTFPGQKWLRTLEFFQNFLLNSLDTTYIDFSCTKGHNIVL